MDAIKYDDYQGNGHNHTLDQICSCLLYTSTLGAVYAGLKLFGITGLFLGPLGLLLIEDMTELLLTQPVNGKTQKNGTSQL